MSGRSDDASPYRDRLYAAYRSTQSGAEEASVSAFAARRAWWEAHVDRLLPTDRSAVILDGACGAGSLVWHLQELGYEAAEGIDISGEEVAAARALELPVRQADLLTELEGRRGELDALVLRDVLEHFRKDELLPLLDAAHDALRPGGVLVVQVPNADSPFFGRIRYGDFTHESAFTTRSLSQVLSATGFGGLRVVPVAPVATSRRSAIRRRTWRVVERLYRLLVAIEFGERPQVVSQIVVASATRLP